MCTYDIINKSNADADINLHDGNRLFLHKGEAHQLGELSPEEIRIYSQLTRIGVYLEIHEESVESFDTEPLLEEEPPISAPIEVEDSSDLLIEAEDFAPLEDLESLSRAQLFSKAKDMGLSLKATLSKAQIIEALRGK